MHQNSTDGLLGWLARLDEKQLATVLQHRADTLLPPWPRRLDVLAARLSSNTSMSKAIEPLPAPYVQALHAVQLCFALGQDPAPIDEIARWLGTKTATVESIVDELQDRALAWREDGGVALPEVLHADAYQQYGLGRSMADMLSALSIPNLRQLSDTLGLPSKGPKRELQENLVAFYRDGDKVRELVATAPAGTRAALVEMAADGPDVENLHVEALSEASPLAWAFARALLFSTYYGMGYMALEISLALRGPDYHLPFTPEPPELPTTTVGAEHAEALASAATLRLLDRATAILDTAAAEPLPLLKDGNVGARLIKKLAKDFGASVPEIELALELLLDTQLLVAVETGPAPSGRGRKAPPRPLGLSPNDEIARPGQAELALLLLTAWWTPSSPEYDHDLLGTAAAYHQLTVRLLAELEPGTAVTDQAAFARMAAWRAPMLEETELAENLPVALAEGELLGVVASGALTTIGRALEHLETDEQPLRDAVGELVARARTTALFGTDLTAIVPGSPDTRLTALLDRVADREAQGTATSWRFSPATVRRAFDQGATAETLLEELRSIAQGELPQPLVYLVNDVARRHGEARVMNVASVVVGEDPATLAEIAAHRKLGKLGLRAIAPTVLTSTVDAAGTLAALRDAGYAPTHHEADGSIILPGTAPQPALAAAVPEPDRSYAAPPPEDPVRHASRLLAAPLSAPPLQRGQLAKAFSDRYGGRLSLDQQRVCWQLEAGQPVPVQYHEEDGETSTLLVLAPELDVDVLDAWCVHENKYRRLALERIELDMS
ncbi:helicase-associated domain-containing protein [Amycolatopsis sp. NPDC059021]|uniref:helicase-associated domain-containing protein n=1 Tax=Amycolatopsis sp. NPDC059021 TaxID=3346704 RepID=UPI003673591B